MRIFKTKRFAKWAKKQKLSDKLLRQAVIEMNQGLNGANLCDDVYKKRIAPQGQGKRGGYRTIVAFVQFNRAFFIFGYAKNEIETLTAEQLSLLKVLSVKLLSFSEAELSQALDCNEIVEVRYE